MCNTNKNLAEAKEHLEAKKTKNHYYLFDDELIVCNEYGEIIKIIHPPSDYDGPFAKHMLVKFYTMYYSEDYLLVVVNNRWNADFWFKLYDDKLELSEDYHRWM